MLNIIIQIQDLPKREKTLSIEEISTIYGGCKPDYRICDYNRDCCSHVCASDNIWKAGICR